MLQLFSITLFALAGFSFAAPTGNRHEVLPIVDAIPSANIIPINWKRDPHQTSSDFGTYSKLINSAINEFLSNHNRMIKRQTSLPNGLPSNGLPSSGLPSNGLPSNGLPSNGLPSNGLPSNGELEPPLEAPLNAPLGNPLTPPIEEPSEDSMTAPLGAPLTTPLDNPLTASSENPLSAPSGDPLAAPSTPPFDIFQTPFDLEVAFRGFFDKFVDFIIQVTPLNDIVHGNYDLLYEIFTNIVKDALSNIGQPPAEGGSPLDFFNILSSLDIFGGHTEGGPSLDFLGNPGLLFPHIFDNPLEGSLDKSKHYKHESKKGGKKWDGDEDGSDNDDEDSEDDDEDSDNDDECEADDDEE